MGFGPWAMGHGPWAMGLRPWALGHGPWAIGHGPWAMGLGPWAMGHGPWALGLGPWALGHGPWAMGHRFPGCISSRWPPVLPVLFSSGTIFSFPVYAPVPIRVIVCLTSDFVLRVIPLADFGEGFFQVFLIEKSIFQLKNRVRGSKTKIHFLTKF